MDRKHRSGASFAAPIVAGITSLMYDRNTNLIWWPEATKAILMASAWHNLEGTPTLSDVDGTGGVSAFYADTMAHTTQKQASLVRSLFLTPSHNGVISINESGRR